MSEMVERVARAIVASLKEASAYVGDTDGTNFVCLDGHFDLLEAARAAIAAMREPTEAMCSKGGDVEIDTSLYSVQVSGAADEVWQAMTDAALSDA